MHVLRASSVKDSPWHVAGERLSGGVSNRNERESEPERRYVRGGKAEITKGNM